MTITETLKKAQQGGYHVSRYDGEAINYPPGTGGPSLIDNAFLDPLFWRALGLALGWQEGVKKTAIPYDQWWRQPWHRFIDHLAEGKPLASFFANL